MRILLDTHTLLWFLVGSPRLSMDARDLVESATNTKEVSMASLWEIAIKCSLGKLRLEQPFDTLFPSQIEQNGFGVLPIQVEHIRYVVHLPFHHGDPFDRLIVAQCKVEDMALISADSQLDAYGIKRLW